MNKNKQTNITCTGTDNAFYLVGAFVPPVFCFVNFSDFSTNLVGHKLAVKPVLGKCGPNLQVSVSADKEHA